MQRTLYWLFAMPWDSKKVWMDNIHYRLDP